MPCPFGYDRQNAGSAAPSSTPSTQVSTPSASAPAITAPAPSLPASHPPVSGGGVCPYGYGKK
jgi:hypothetical protein